MTGEITEIVGGQGCGKTQVALTTALQVASTTPCSVVYLDSSGGLSAKRMAGIFRGGALMQQQAAMNAAAASQISQEANASAALYAQYMSALPKALQKITVYTPHNIWTAMNILDALAKELEHPLKEDSTRLRLLVIDSVTALLAPIMVGAPGWALMMEFASLLKRMAEHHHLAILITNNTVTNRRSQSSGATRPALGEAWSFVPSTRVELSRDFTTATPASSSATASTVRFQASLTRSARGSIPSTTSFDILPSGALLAVPEETPQHVEEEEHQHPGIASTH